MSLSLLRRSPLLRMLPAPALAHVNRIAKWCEYPSGAQIFDRKDPPSHMYIVSEGRVKIYSASGGKKRKTFAYLGPGAFFGEMALLDGLERSACAQAVERTRLLLIHKRDFLYMLLTEPKLGLFLLREMSRRLRRADQEIEGLMFRNVLGRVSKTLVNLAGRGRLANGGTPLRARYTHQELADLVGTTREPLSRALAALKRAELVDVRQGQLYVRDLGKLRALTGEG
ncbi:MAG: Crp/Fnr family transcriptional regulator [Elusimicrobia bacterium]|nr:Crp/Fnr family transcriptional regulator [Elusimicrobiota bacterium]